MKFTYICSFLGIVLAAFVSAGREYTICDFYGECTTYTNLSMEQAALTLVAVVFLVRGFIGLLVSSIIPDESYQGDNFVMDIDIEKRDEYFRSNDYYLYLKTFDVDVGGF